MRFNPLNINIPAELVYKHEDLVASQNKSEYNYLE